MEYFANALTVCYMGKAKEQIRQDAEYRRALKATRLENQPAVEEFRTLVAVRLKERYATYKQGGGSMEALERACGVDRGIIGKILSGRRGGYNVDSLIRVMMQLKADIDVIQANNSRDKALMDQLALVLGSHIPKEIHFVMDALERAVKEVKAAQEAARSGPIKTSGKSRRSA